MVSSFGVRIRGFDISSIFGESNIAGVTGAFGEVFAYYLFLDPATSSAGREVACLKSVRVDQVPMMVAAGYSSPSPVGPR